MFIEGPIAPKHLYFSTTKLKCLHQVKKPLELLFVYVKYEQLRKIIFNKNNLFCSIFCGFHFFGKQKQNFSLKTGQMLPSISQGNIDNKVQILHMPYVQK